MTINFFHQHFRRNMSYHISTIRALLLLLLFGSMIALVSCKKKNKTTEIEQFTLTLTASTDGEIKAYTDEAHTTPVGDLTKISKGTKIYLIITPNQGKVVTTVTGADMVATDKLTAEVTMTANKTIEATYVTGYILTFDANNGTGIMATQAFKKDVPQAIIANTFTREGYTFYGWTTNIFGGDEYADKQVISLTSDTKLYALWQEIFYFIVTFIPESGSVTPTTKQVIYGKPYGTLPIPTRTNYTFEGWCTQSGGAGEQIVATTIVTDYSNHFLYAKWAIKTNMVSFNSNSGTTVANITDVPYNTTITQPTDPTKTGYTFAGWYKEATLTNAWNFATDKITKDTTLYAKWFLTPQPCPGTPTVKDINNNTYNTVQIGSQCWLKENLRATSLNQGAPIPVISGETNWGNQTDVQYNMCYVNDNSSTATTYGALYNWNAVSGGRLCPTGWHVPSNAEWNTLATYLGDSVGGKMKITWDWESPNAAASNESGFSALPVSWRTSYGYFVNYGTQASFWSSTYIDDNIAPYRILWYNNKGLQTNTASRKTGMSVRCIKD